MAAYIKSRKNIAIQFSAAFVLLIILAISVFSLNIYASISLDQNVRCGITEHIHTEECYEDTLLICTQQVHTHDENCYLVLLSDNDINTLVETIDEDENKSLEGVISSLITNTIEADSSINASSSDGLVSSDISSINSAAEQYNVSPAVVLNENISTSNISGTGYSLTLSTAEEESATSDTSTDTDTDTDSGTSSSDDGVSVIADDNLVYFYIMLDGNLTQIGSKSLTSSSSSYTISASDIYSLYSGYVTSITSSNIGSTYYVRYTTSTPSSSSSFSSSTTVKNSTVTFGSGSNRPGSSSSVTPPLYAILSTKSSSSGGGGGSGSNSYTPVNFYTATLIFDDGSKLTEYVQSGLNSTLTLSEDYDWYSDSSKTNVADSSALEGMTSAVTLYAFSKGYTVTFDTGGGTAIESQLVANDGNAVAVQPANPTKEGYVFGGWYIDESCTTTYNFSSYVTDNITIYAKWTATTGYTFTFKDENGIITSVKNNLTYDETVTLPSLKDGYIWQDANGKLYIGGASVTVKGDNTFTTIEKVLEYTVTFDSGNGTAVASQTVFHGYTAEEPEAPTQTDYIFGGWYTDSDCTTAYDFDTPVTSDITLYALWMTDARLYHIDLTIAAEASYSIYVDGVATTYTVTGELNNETMTYYSADGTVITQVVVEESSYDDYRGAYEYMMAGYYEYTNGELTNSTEDKETARHGGEYYYGGYVTVTFDYTYTDPQTGEEVTIAGLSYTEYMTETENDCEADYSSDETMRGYDVTIESEFLEYMLSSTGIEVKKIWNNTDSFTELPQITVAVERNDGEIYYYDIASSDWTEADGVYSYVADNLPKGTYITGTDGNLTWYEYSYTLLGETAIDGVSVSSGVAVSSDGGYWDVEISDDGTIVNTYVSETVVTEPLPSTGSTGTSAYIYSGIMMMLSAVVLYIIKHRREEKLLP